ncbi:MAG: ribonuclease HII [Chloroflexi bacterium]|nr:MAG: ribonuclease HII [Chloroflexota bacterium]
MSSRFDTSLLPPDPDLSFESTLWECGILSIAGVDEAGRGPLAGPVSAAAVILPPGVQIATKLYGVRDSKQMRREEREYWETVIKDHSCYCAVGFASVEEIDQIGIVPATRLAAQRALDSLNALPEHILLDFIHLPECSIPQTSLIKGDCRSLSIASASVLAKTARDACLRELDQVYPGYGLAEHKGYGTPAHLRALKELGPCPIHRRSFHPVCDLPELKSGLNAESKIIPEGIS